MTENNENQGNWNQPWLWFTLAPLILSVVLGLTMLNISFHIQDGLVTDEYSKEGLAINEQIEKEVKAKDIQAEATISLDAESGELTLDFTSQLTELPANLMIELVHPIIKDKDISVVLTHNSQGRYLGQVENGIEGKRYVSIHELQNPTWVLKGELHFPISSATTLSAH
ncbi:FixH family protein [Litoribrevibacter albus]|uniref:Membrane protein n=1 Tax=Litoribrevibacter albus TaxID=1473156 RepID=A0AA37W4X3_9GAMM|nr:FixH family protein [Litoribrevibacter albus]GLQ30085.1 membrane protein [Litoribrevibacter albus]